jgi:hypothetical protein
MNEFELYKLFKLVFEFRKAFEKCCKELLPSSFKNFPSGCSCDVALILAHYLKENGYGEFDYVHAARWNQPHFWLERDNIIIDLTPDQFEDQESKVMVTLDSKWHGEFNIEGKHKASLELYDTHTRDNLLNDYKLIIKNIGHNT